MKNLDEIKSKITDMINERYHSPGSFEEFSEKLIDLGIIRLNFDTMTHELCFYSAHKRIHSIIRTDLIENQKKTSWILGESLNLARLENAIQELDAGRMTSGDFHREIFFAGVVSCTVYLLHKKAFYLGQDSHYYIEKY